LALGLVSPGARPLCRNLQTIYADVEYVFKRAGCKSRSQSIRHHENLFGVFADRIKTVVSLADGARKSTHSSLFKA